MSTQLEKYRLEEKNFSNELLLPLRFGKPIALKVTDSKMYTKRRVDMPILFITPTEVFGLGRSSLIFSLTGGGCEVMEKKNLKTVMLFRIGLTMRSAKVLVKELNSLFSIKGAK